MALLISKATTIVGKIIYAFKNFYNDQYMAPSSPPKKPKIKTNNVKF